MDEQPKRDQPPPKRKVEIDLRDLFANKDPKAGSVLPKPPSAPSDPARPN
jgi:hypothetical protein